MGANESIETVLRRALREFRAAVRSPDRKTTVRKLLEDLRADHDHNGHGDPTSHALEESRRALLDSYPEGRSSRIPLIGGLIAAFRLRAGRARSSIAAVQAELVSHVSTSFGNAIAAALTLSLGVVSAPGVAPAMHHVGRVYVVTSGDFLPADERNGLTVSGLPAASRGVMFATGMEPASGFGSDARLKIHKREREIRIEQYVTAHAVGQDPSVGGTVLWVPCTQGSTVKTALCDAYETAVLVSEGH